MMRPCDVVVHASLIPEPFGMTVIEGMAAGAAVVAANTGGPTETIDPARRGSWWIPWTPKHWQRPLEAFCLTRHGERNWKASRSPRQGALLGRAIRR